MRHGHSSYAAQDLIDWDATEDHMHHLPQARRRWVTKTASENCGAGTTLLSWGKQDHSKCVRCPCQQEMVTHCIQCNGYGADEVWQTNHDALSTWLEREHTCPDIQRALLNCLAAWRQGRRINQFEHPKHVRPAIRAQTKIRWLALMEGQPAKQWQLLQRQYHLEHGYKRSSKKWIKGALYRLNALAWGQWKHRNDCKFNYIKPHEKEVLAQLDRAVIRHFLQGSSKVSVGDRYHFNHSLMSLLNRPVPYKQNWLANVISAEQHCRRRQQQAADQVLLSHADSVMLCWMRTGHLSPPRRRLTHPP